MWAVDTDTVALEVTERNARRVGLTNVAVVTPREVPLDLDFAAIYSNPPIKIGKDALHSLLLEWLPRLERGGAAQLVVKKSMGADSLAAWLSTQSWSVARVASKKGYRLLTVRRSSAS